MTGEHVTGDNAGTHLVVGIDDDACLLQVQLISEDTSGEHSAMRSIIGRTVSVTITTTE